MKKLNIILGIIFAIAYIMVCLSDHLEIPMKSAEIVCFIVAAIIGYVALKEVYYFKTTHSYNATLFWYIYSVIFGAIVITTFIGLTASGVSLLENERMGQLFVIGLSMPLCPIFGIWIGLLARWISNSKSSKKWLAVRWY